MAYFRPQLPPELEFDTDRFSVTSGVVIWMQSPPASAVTVPVKP